MEKASKKWSLGVLFKKNKKEIPSVDFSSEDEDRNAGFNPESIRKLPAGKFKSNRQLVENFDQQKYSIANPEFHYFKPQQQPINQNTVELKNNQRNIERSKSGILQPHQYIYSHHGSSQDEKSSYNSLSPMHRQDSENTSNGSKNSLNKKSRSARNERYFSRLQRDSYAEPDTYARPQTVYGSVSSVDNYPKYFSQPSHNYVPSNGLSASNKSSSLCSSDLVHPKTSYEDKDYENIHVSPPPIPKRDPNRRFSVNCSQNNNYYFDHNLQKYVIFNANGRCFSDDKLWKNDYNQQQQNINGFVRQSNYHDNCQRNDILSPRSRKPLHIATNLDQSVVDYSSSRMKNSNQRSQSDLEIPTIISDKSNLLKKKTLPINQFQAKKPEIYSTELLALRKKYSSADDINQNNRLSCSTLPVVVATINKSLPFQAPKKPARKIDLASSNNLDEAITELEKMYASLMNDHKLIDRAEKRENHDTFSELVKSYDDYENEEESYNDCEPDIVLDDLFSRNLQHSNKQIKVVDTQKPFGIPVGPIPPTPSTDYLTAEPIQMRKSGFAAQHNPDVVADDFAVRNLRKDFYGRRKGNTITMDNNHHMKRNHTLSSISDNIYSEILKNAARPNGGMDFSDDYLNLEKLVTPEERRSCSRDLKSTLYHVNKNQLEPVNATSRKDFEQTLDDLVVESKAISQKLEKDLTKLKRESLSVTPTRRTMVDILDYRKNIKNSQSPHLPEKPKVTTKSTACSPIQDLIDPPILVVKDVKDVKEIKESKVKVEKVEKTEKIGNLIQMFNNNDRQISTRRRNVSDITGMIKSPLKELSAPKSTPITTQIAPKQFPKQHLEVAKELNIIHQITPNTAEQDVESNINNIKELIQQIKQTDFQNQAQPIAQLEDLPDYDNLQDYEMTNGKLERKPNQESPKVEVTEEYMSDLPKSTPSSSTTRATSLDSGSKSSTHDCKSPADIYESAMEFLNESATSVPENPLVLQLKEKSPIEYLREDTEQVLNIIEQINDNLVTAKGIEKVAAPQLTKDELVSETESNEYNSTEELSMIFGISEPPADKISMMYDSTLLELNNILRDATNNGSAYSTYDKTNDKTIQLQNNPSCPSDPSKRSAEVHANSAQSLINIIRMDKRTPSNRDSEEHNLISASLTAQKLDKNTNHDSKSPQETPKECKASTEEKEVAADAELKPTKLGMMPFDLRSELKSKLGGGFNLKKSSTNVDIFSNSNNRKVAEKTAETSTSELLRSLRDKQGKIVDENGQENLSFKEKLKLIEKSSQLALLPPASTTNLLAKSKSHSIVSQNAERTTLKLKLDDLKKSAESSIEIYKSSEEENEMPDQESSTAKNGSTIAERLALLKTNGENNWRKRVVKKELSDDSKDDNTEKADSEVEFTKPQLREVKSLDGGKITDRLEKIQINSEKWKKRIEPTDASKFKISGYSDEDPPKLQFTKSDVKKSPPMVVFKSDNIHLLKLTKSTSTTSAFIKTTEQKKKSFNRSYSVQETNAKGHVEKILLPTNDDEETFKNFFPTVDRCEIESPVDMVDMADFDDVKIETTRLSKLSYKKTTQGPKRRKPNTNPIKSLANRIDICNEYTEIITDQCDSPSKNATSKFTSEALAGLASTEDFTAISLKSSADPMNISWLPYKPIMLLHIKGRRTVQIRLVEPVFGSLNQGDCFILVAEDKLFSFIGRSANVIEKAHCKDIITQILRDKDLGCSATSSTMINEKNLDSYNGRGFCKILGRAESQDLDKLTDAGHNDEDELFEACLLETNKIYELVDDSLVPIAEYWGTIPTISMLNSEKVLIFDFGSELYVWNGRNAMPAAKNLALQLSEELFSLKYDYEMCDLCPINYADLVGHRKSLKIQKSGAKRPAWCLFGKVSQNMETVVFREKFKDWPDIKIHFKHAIVSCNEIQKIDGAALFKKQSYEEPNLVLDSANLGRGNFYYDPETRRHFDVIQVSVSKWHTTDEEVQNQAHFYANECYSIKFIYQMNITVRELTGKVSDRGTVGRDRCALFDWQGKISSATEKGAIALQSIELNKEKGTQMVIEQGYELPCFVRLFKVMYVHRNRTNESRFQKWRMYLITGNDVEETIVQEVLCSPRQLRSRACILLIHGHKMQLGLWKGCKSTNNTQNIARNVCNKLQANPCSELFKDKNITFTEYDEGTEPASFFEVLGGNDRSAYNSLLKAKETFEFTPRLYEFTSKNGSFEANEVISNMRTSDHPTMFPFIQEDLYNCRQPSLFMLDNEHALYVWVGWWPVEDTEILQDDLNNDLENRAGESRWQQERFEAMTTASAYWKTKCSGSECEKKAFIISAGFEPVEFISIFPEWIVRDDIAELNGENATSSSTTIAEYLSLFKQKTYPLSELLNRKCKLEGINRFKMELYLSESDFEMCLGMKKEEFDNLPLWKKNKLKKEKGLF